MPGKERPSVCFVPTASGDSPEYADRFLRAFAGRAETSVLSLFGREPWGYGDPAMVLEQDVVYVGGGSTANLLALWRLHRLDERLREAAANGTVLASRATPSSAAWPSGSSPVPTIRWYAACRAASPK